MMFHNAFLHIALCMLFLVLLSCHPYNTGTEQCLDISHGWSLTISHNPVSSISIGVINLPHIFTPYLLHNFNTYQGYATIKKKIYIPLQWYGKPLILYLGKIGDADVAYCNGHMIGFEGAFPQKEFSVWNKDRIYMCSPDIIQYGSFNTIEVRIACLAYNRIVGKPFIAPLHDYEELSLYNYFYNLKFSLPLYINTGIGITFLFIFILLCKNKKFRNQYITFILQLVPGFFVILEPTLPIPLFDTSIARMKAFGIAWSLLVLFHLLFLHRIYNYARKKIEFTLALMTFVLVTLILYASTIPSIKFASMTVIGILTPLSLYNLSLHFQQLFKGNNFAKLFFPVGIILALTAAHDGIVYLSVFTFRIFSIFGYSFVTPVFQYTSLFIFIGAGLIIVYQFINVSNDLEQMNIHLEKKVEERTKELKESLDNLSKAIEFGFFVYPRKNLQQFSPRLEPKIKQAIVYINNNFYEQISREGLASMLNLHPDYFSKAFKYYTGKPLHEYINELRLKEAIKLLQQSQKTILEIAMQVGFENLKTFNRAFKKFTGKNPSDYRK